MVLASLRITVPHHAKPMTGGGVDIARHVVIFLRVEKVDLSPRRCSCLILAAQKPLTRLQGIAPFSVPSCTMSMPRGGRKSNKGTWI